MECQWLNAPHSFDDGFPRFRCNHHHYLLDTAGVPPGATDVLPTTSTASKPPQHQPFTTYVPSISLTNTNGEIDTQALVRAWYQAGYAMGQAHADQVGVAAVF